MNSELGAMVLEAMLVAWALIELVTRRPNSFLCFSALGALLLGFGVTAPVRLSAVPFRIGGVLDVLVFHAVLTAVLSLYLIWECIR